MKDIRIRARTLIRTHTRTKSPLRPLGSEQQYAGRFKSKVHFHKHLMCACLPQPATVPDAVCAVTKGAVTHCKGVCSSQGGGQGPPELGLDAAVQEVVREEGTGLGEIRSWVRREGPDQGPDCGGRTLSGEQQEVPGRYNQAARDNMSVCGKNGNGFQAALGEEGNGKGAMVLR